MMEVVGIGGDGDLLGVERLRWQRLLVDLGRRRKKIVKWVEMGW